MTLLESWTLPARVVAAPLSLTSFCTPPVACSPLHHQQATTTKQSISVLPISASLTLFFFDDRTLTVSLTMAASLQSPLLHVPTKRTDEVDFTTPFRSYISSVYQDDPDKYATEIATLHRLRQDSRGAGKDVTGRDILYRYYGQLELLDLRFPVDEKHVKVLFTWYVTFGDSLRALSALLDRCEFEQLLSC